MEKIASFTNKYRFLSNFWLCAIELDGEQYASVEHAYQAAKTLNPDERAAIRCTPSPNIAKKKGRWVTLRDNWKDIRVSVMRDLVSQKFARHRDLRDVLLSTGDAELIEGNWWGDTFWGVCEGLGDNNLGKILMEERARYGKSS